MSLLSPAEVNKFKEILSNYAASEDSISEFIKSSFAIIAGPAGAGKDTLRNYLLKNNLTSYQAVLSTTTRPAREGEVDGTDYHFRSPEFVYEALSKGEFFQAALVHGQQVSCLHIDEIKKLSSGQTGLSILIVQTEEELNQLKPDIKTIFLIPPSLEILKQRLQADRTLETSEVDRRLQAAKKELEIALGRDDYYCLISDDLSDLSQLADKFLQTGERIENADKSARRIVKQILNVLSINSW